MLTLTRGNILEAGTEALVNTVNTVGVMGKGIALQFKRAFPENYEAYRRACDRGELAPGRLLVYETGWLNPPKYIINFPTKTHWRSGSRLEDIEAGLQTLVKEIQRLAFGQWPFRLSAAETEVSRGVTSGLASKPRWRSSTTSTSDSTSRTVLPTRGR